MNFIKGYIIINSLTFIFVGFSDNITDYIEKIIYTNSKEERELLDFD